MMMTMATNLFSIFDPSTSYSLSLNWLSMTIVFMMIPYPMWTQASRASMAWASINKIIYSEFKILLSYSFSNILLMSSLFMIIMFNNFMGLFPYIFTSSSHMSFCLSLSLSMWIGMMAYSIINYFNDLCSHLTPQGTPAILMPFMVMIESISLIIRPFTLAIRLTANMIAGHLLLSLLGSAGQSLMLPLMPILMGTQFLLLTLEISVSIIQAYVFSVLTTLYTNEI